MKKISRINYELFFLDYLDGKLTDQEIRDMENFLLLNPDLRAELEGTERAILKPEDIPFENKDSLYKIDLSLPVNESNLEDFCIAANEGDLSIGQLEELKNYLKSHEYAEKVYEVYRNLNLSPDSKITYPEKNKLKRTVFAVPKDYIIPVLSVAAAITLILVLYLRNDNFNKAFNNIASELPSAVSERPGNSNNHVSEKVVNDNLAAKDSQIHLDQFALVTPKEKKQASSLKNDAVQLKKNMGTKSKDLLPPQKLNPSFQIKLPSVADNNIYIPAIDGGKITYSPVSSKPAPKEYLTLTEYARRQISQKVLGNSTDPESRITAWQLADAGLTGISKLTGAKMKLEKKTDENGNLTAYSFDSKLFSFSTTSVNKR